MPETYSKPLHSGWLEKQVESRIGWRRRYFVLSEKTLAYYQTKSAAKAGADPNASAWSLEQCTVSNHRAGGLNLRWHLCLHMHPQHNSKHNSSWVLSSAKRDDILTWVAKLRQVGVVDNYRTAVPPVAVHWAGALSNHGIPGSQQSSLNTWATSQPLEPESIRLEQLGDSAAYAETDCEPQHASTALRRQHTNSSSGGASLASFNSSVHSATLVNALLRSSSERRTSGRDKELEASLSSLGAGRARGGSGCSSRGGMEKLPSHARQRLLELLEKDPERLERMLSVDAGTTTYDAPHAVRRRPSSIAAVAAIQRLARGWTSRRYQEAESKSVEERDPGLPMAPVAAVPPDQRTPTSVTSIGGSAASPATVACGHVLVLGALNIDMRAVADSCWPEGGMTTVGTLTFAPGGAGSHQAVCLSKLGVATHLIGRCGADEMGRLLLAHLDDLALPLLDTSGIRAESGAPTGVAVQLATSLDGRSAHNMICSGANASVGQREVEAALSLLPSECSGAPQPYAAEPPPAASTVSTFASRSASLSTRGGDSLLPGEHTAASPASAHPTAMPNLPDGNLVLLTLELPSKPLRAVARSARKRGCRVVLRASPLPHGVAEYAYKAEALLRAVCRAPKAPTQPHGTSRRISSTCAIPRYSPSSLSTPSTPLIPSPSTPNSHALPLPALLLVAACRCAFRQRV